MASVDVVADSPGAICVVTSVLDADDHKLDESPDQFVPLNSVAKVPLRKVCISEAEIVEALAEGAAKPNVLWNAVSIALFAADVAEEN